MLRYSLVITTRNSDCIESFFGDLYTLEDLSHLDAIVVIDNNSSEQFVEKLKKQISSLKEDLEIDVFDIYNDKNVLYSRASNQGLHLLHNLVPTSEYYIIVNPDIRISADYCGTNKDPFLEVIDDMRHLGGGIAGAQLVRAFGPRSEVLVEHAGGVQNTHRGFNQPINTFDTADTVEWVTGALFAIKKSTLKKIGYLDAKNYTHWVSDQEYCRRAGFVGISTVYSPVIFTHNQGGSTPHKSHTECWLDLPRGIEPNVIPATLGSIITQAQRNARHLPIQHEDDS